MKTSLGVDAVPDTSPLAGNEPVNVSRPVEVQSEMNSAVDTNVRIRSPVNSKLEVSSTVDSSVELLNTSAPASSQVVPNALRPEGPQTLWNCNVEKSSEAYPIYKLLFSACSPDLLPSTSSISPTRSPALFLLTRTLFPSRLIARLSYDP